MEATPSIGEVGSAIRSKALGDPNAAALRGLQVGPKSPKAISTLQSVEGARPYLSGAKDLQDLQSRIGPAKNEIFGEYNKAVEGIGDRPVKGPDGMTTVRALETERQQLSALNRGLKQQNPEAIQLAQQKGMTQAQLLDRERAVQSALDPQLASTGINPQLTRQTYGNVAQIGQRMSGKSTLIEDPQPSGLGKIGQISIKNPLQAPGKIMSGIRDIAAGRPMLSAKPTDLGINEGFRGGGPKPDLGKYSPFQPKGLLGTPTIELGAPQEAGGTPEGYRPPPFYRDTTAMRTGRLLNAPPIELGGATEGTRPPPFYRDTATMRTGRLLNAPPESPIELGGKVEGSPPPRFHYDTTPMRMGRTLPAPSNEVPMSSHSDIFPDQLPSGALMRPKRVGQK